ncbi:hypothetical protein CTKA_00795 [Chthonomonas calidirosea]|uniref:Peptidase MA superfamily n=2 Tax=Chthonomonas TaxID=1077265 RepID=S0ESI8_CHTCT|nr:hypothetical protein CCALI_00362 [Chthonomonas calidirosea T49]CEK15475.1 hypothetical protein CTKA_00795 [Chthonomonas calidirosea]
MRLFLLKLGFCFLLTQPTHAQSVPPISSTHSLMNRSICSASLQTDKTLTVKDFGKLVSLDKPISIFNPHDRQMYHVELLGYVAPSEDSSLRFRIYAPERSDAELAEKVGLFYLLLYHEIHKHLHLDHPAQQPISVWLSPTNYTNADVGGEQFRDQIYIYNIYAKRSSIEWCRELAHEYGHYILPGVTGYTAPEPWANGVLGERLFLYWLSHDVTDGTIPASSLPFCTPADLEAYLNLQIFPLISRIALAQRFSSSWLSRQDAVGMDNYTAICLYIDDIYGSHTLLEAMAFTEPSSNSPLVTAPDFLNGFYKAMQNLSSITLSIPLIPHPLHRLLLYLPSGLWHIPSNIAWQVVNDKLVIKNHTLFVPQSGWYAIHFTTLPSLITLTRTLPSR